MSIFRRKKHKPPHCGNPPHDGVGCGCAFVLFMFWFWLPTVLFILRFGNKKGKKGGVVNSLSLRGGTKPKVAFISVYNIPCGIATYNEKLLAQISRYVDLRVFAEYADDQKLERLETDPDFVYRCWDRKEHPKTKLMIEVDNWKPDVIHFGHEYGFFSSAYLFTSLVSWFKARQYPVIATMHSIYEHRDKTVQEASGQHIIAHTTAGLNCLQNKGLKSESISVIPHGTDIFSGDDTRPQLLSPLWNTWQNNHTIFQPGFLFDYKGHLRMLHVVAELKRKYPDIHYIIQGSENPKNAIEHEALYRKIIATCKKLNIESNVTINRGFVSEDVLLSFIRTAKVCVLPYANHPEHDVCSTSGIARIIIGTETPLVTTQVHLFDDLNGVAFKAKNDADLYNCIDSIFENPEMAKLQNPARIEFLKHTSWSSVAKQHVELYFKVLSKH
jgi:glycosyltransferase involved in cell wall biosynthesis